MLLYLDAGRNKTLHDKSSLPFYRVERGKRAEVREKTQFVPTRGIEKWIVDFDRVYSYFISPCPCPQGISVLGTVAR
jgi:hypothetical protein